MKILTVIGARPQFIKAAAFSHALKKRTDIEEVLIHTGQHFDSNMSEVFFTQLQIPKPKYNLNCGSLGHGAMTGLALKEIEDIIKTEKPNFLLVYGDTNATLAGALAAAKLHVPVVHVEAGLRSYDHKMPEELNRVLTDSVSSILCTPSEIGLNNLEKEGFPRYKHQTILNTGDIQFDSTLLFANLNTPLSEPVKKLQDESKEKPYFLLTMHRPSNVDHKDKLSKISLLLKNLSKTHKIVFPIHPRTSANLKKFNLDFDFVTMLPPVGYTEMLTLIKASSGVITDSGGLQKESYYLNKNTVVLRDSTEWVELLENHSSILANEDSCTENLLTHLTKPQSSKPTHTYGKGDAAVQIINAIGKHTHG